MPVQDSPALIFTHYAKLTENGVQILMYIFKLMILEGNMEDISDPGLGKNVLDQVNKSKALKENNKKNPQVLINRI